jgi:RHS repeat-associated protein
LIVAYTTGNAACTGHNTTGTGYYNHTYGYNAIGNLTDYDGALYTYGLGKPHAVSDIPGASYNYDGNGNQTSRTVGGTAYTFTFDRENRLTAVSGGTVNASFVYDADGNRVKGTIGGVTTVYIAGLYEYQGGAITHYYGNGALRRAGFAGANGLIYVMQDQLQSSSLYVTRGGVLTQHNHYYPYGGRRGSPFNIRSTKRFTGQYHEQDLPGGEGLSYYGARWYDAKLGRFISADTVVPQSEIEPAPVRFLTVAYDEASVLRDRDQT